MNDLSRLSLPATTLLVVLTSLTGCESSPDSPSNAPALETVPFVDVQRYLGKWYEIASFPHFFQRGCTGTTATYTLKDDGRVDVLNECHKDSLDGKKTRAHGTAEVVDTKTNAKLKVWFFWPFKGDYWVIDLGANYDYAVIGHPNRKYLWILSRTPRMDPATYDDILDRIKAKGYDLSPLQRTLQR